MSPKRDARFLTDLVARLRTLVGEAEWVEFKHNNADPQMIGEYISALSNSSALAGQPYGYIVWGIQDSDKAIVGTTFEPPSSKIGNESLENWLLRGTIPQVHFRFHEVTIDRARLVILEIEAARYQPITFYKVAFVRVSQHKKKLQDHPDHERRLWRQFDSSPFEAGIAFSQLRDEQVVSMIDYPAYFELFDKPLPERRSSILSALEADRLIQRDASGGWDIKNLGAILFAKRISDFDSLQRKAVRVVQYRGNSRAETVREQEGTRGYAVGFQGIIDYIVNLLPMNEQIGTALRQTVPMYPVLAIRELVANALIHQDFSQTGTGPMIELFDDRLEITSPGEPLVDPARFIDASPRSRNESLAYMMRLLGICEERGSGWDKVGFEIEFHQLPAPLVEIPGASTRVVLFNPRPLQEMTKDERIRAVYLHACLRYVSREPMTNSSIRERFGIAPRNSAMASRLISDAIDAGVVAPYDPDASKKQMRYVPWWAT